jgi:predicted transcriptional regulator
MRRSKLELYEEILGTLATKHLPMDGVAFECKMDCTILSQRLDFLLKNDLIEERTRNKKQFYALTRRGATIHRTLSIAKRLEKLQTTVKSAEDAVQTLSTFSEQDEEKTAHPM